MLINIKVCPHRCSKFQQSGRRLAQVSPHHGHSPCSSIAPQDSWGDMMLWLEGRPHQCQPPLATAMLINVKVCPHRCSKFQQSGRRLAQVSPHHGHSPCSSIAPQDSWGDMMSLAGREATSIPTSPGNSHAHQRQSLSTQVLQIPTVRKKSWYNFSPIMDIRNALALLHKILGEI